MSKARVNFKKGGFITIIKDLEQPGYYSANKLYEMNANNREMEGNEELPIISQLLTSGDYYVPSYLSLYGKKTVSFDEDDDEDTTTDEDEEDEDEDVGKKENIIINITPVGKNTNDGDKVIEEELYNKLVDAVALSSLATPAVKQPQHKKTKNKKRKTQNNRKKITKKKYRKN